MFRPAYFDSSSDFAAEAMLLETEASSLLPRAEHPCTPPKRGRLHSFSCAGQNAGAIVIVVSVLLFLSVSDGAISARRGRSKSQDSRLQTNTRDLNLVRAKPT